jgi:hypothetical protein
MVFAMIFLTLIILGVITLQSGNLAMMNRQTNEVQAHLFANQALEITQALAGSLTENGEFILTDDGTDYGITANDAGINGAPIEPEDLFFRKLIVDNDQVAPSFKVTAVIFWEDSTGEHFVEAKRIISP